MVGQSRIGASIMPIDSSANGQEECSFTELCEALDDAASLYRDTNSASQPNTSTSNSSTNNGGGLEGNPSQTSPTDSNNPSDVTHDATREQGGNLPNDDQQDNQSNNKDDGSNNKDDESNTAERKAFNHSQAAMRIARKREKDRKKFEERIRRLKAERDEYSDEKSERHSPTMAVFKEDQIKEAEIQEAQRLQDEFIRESYEIFQDENVTKAFIDDVSFYGEWINEREPQLLEYVNKPFGKLLLKGWLDKIAKNKEKAIWWDSLTPFEKYKTLDKNYKAITSYIDNPNSILQKSDNNNDGRDENNQVNTPKDIPVPNSGRNTNNTPPTDNIAFELDKALQLNGAKHFVR